MLKFDRRHCLLFIGLMGIFACSSSHSPSLTSEQPSTRKHGHDLKTQEVASSADPAIAIQESVEYYSAGQVRRKYESYHDGHGGRILHGAFVEFYPNGNQFCAGRYRRGKRDGQWKFWHQSGQTARLASYAHGVADGKWIWYRPTGTRAREVSYFNGRLDGESISYAQDGKTPMELQTYRSGRRHGLMSRWYASGQTAVEIEFKNGVPDGREIRWHENGQKQAEGHHRAGSPHGVFNYWASDGTPIKSVEWRNGRRVNRLADLGRHES